MSRGFGQTCEGCTPGHTYCEFTQNDRVIRLADDIRPLRAIAPEGKSFLIFFLIFFRVN